MEAFIRSSACVAPLSVQPDDLWLPTFVSLPPSPFLKVVVPSAKELVPANVLRRASPILKMGLSAGLTCLRQAGWSAPDAVIIGTAQGCFDDTDKFMRLMEDQEEQMLSPTHFIQSTHNTLAGQLALITQCRAYNQTYVHQSLSFEYALTDALMLLQEGEAAQVLLGGLDEMPPALQELFDRAGHIKSRQDLDTPIWQSHSRGYCAGEGAAFFGLEHSKSDKSVCRVLGLSTLSKVEDETFLLSKVEQFLKDLSLQVSDIDLVLSGINGDSERDRPWHRLSARLDRPLAYFKHLCGEYFTASAFALWLASAIFERGEMPAAIFPDGKTPALQPKKILIINHGPDQHGSFICVSAC